MSDTDKAEQKKESAPSADKMADSKADKNPGASKDASINGASKSAKRSSSAAPKAWPALFALTLFSAVLGAGIATYLTSPAGNARLTQLETRLTEIDVAAGTEVNLRGDLNGVEEDLGQLETRVTSLENAPGATGDFDPRLGQLVERLSAIENAVPADLAARLNGFATREDQEALVARMGELEQTNSGETLLRAGRILALSDLSRAARGSAPFAIELQAAAATLPDEPIVDALRPHAGQGAPTPAQLIARFPEAARQALAAESISDAENIFARLWNSFASLISIRRVGDIEGDDSGARFARADAALLRDDLATAAGELEALEGAAAQSIRPWLQDAQARLSIEDAIAGINTRIVQILASQSAPDQTVPASAP
ncbi:MAG: mitofilin family membrane protein [Micropepsaceae bacterium]